MSVISDAATVVARSLKSVSELSFLDGKLIGVCSLLTSVRLLGLINCEEALLGQLAKEDLLAEWRRDLDSKNSAEMECSAVSTDRQKRTL